MDSGDVSGGYKDAMRHLSQTSPGSTGIQTSSILAKSWWIVGKTRQDWPGTLQLKASGKEPFVCRVY